MRTLPYYYLQTRFIFTMKDSTKYTLQQSLGWQQFESICYDFMRGRGYSKIQKVGNVADGGIDAIILRDGIEVIIFQFSQEANPLRKGGKFWKEYKKWKGKTGLESFVFVSNRELGIKKIEIQKDLKSPIVTIFDVTDIVHFLDNEPAGITAKRNHAIFAKDLEEVFGAEDRLKKLSEVAEVVNVDEHYDVETLLSEQGQITRPGAAFSIRQGKAIQFFTPKSKDDFKKALPNGSFELTFPNSPEGKKLHNEFQSYLRTGSSVSIPSINVRNARFKLGNKLIYDGGEKDTSLQLRTAPSETGRLFVWRTLKDKQTLLEKELFISKAGSEEVTFDNISGETALDIELVFNIKNLALTFNCYLHKERCFDVHEAYQILNFFSKINQDEIDILIYDKGIELPICNLPPMNATKVPASYLELLKTMDEIQNFFKRRFPNPLVRKLEKSDVVSTYLLHEIIEKGKAEFPIKTLSFCLSPHDAERMDTSAEINSLALRYHNEQKLLSILGVTDFSNLELVAPRARCKKSPTKDGSGVQVDVDVLETPYLHLSS